MRWRGIEGDDGAKASIISRAPLLLPSIFAHRFTGRFASRYFGCMHAVSRLLQMLGLTIPPLAIIAQLGEHITAGEMLKFLVVSVCLFGTGYLLQTYRGGGA